MYEPPNMLSIECFIRFKTEEIEEQNKVWETREDRNVKVTKSDLAE